MNRTFLFAVALLTAGILGGATVRSESQTAAAAQAERAAAPRRLTGDEAYKTNCTRCHSELPKVNARATKTILMHMRVRANMPADEVRAILDYLTQ